MVIRQRESRRKGDETDIYIYIRIGGNFPPVENEIGRIIDRGSGGRGMERVNAKSVPLFAVAQARSTFVRLARASSRAVTLVQISRDSWERTRVEKLEILIESVRWIR